MAANLISFPFRLNNAGTVAVLEDGTEDYYAEQLAVLVLTRPGERSMVPDFGVTDPAFDGFNDEELGAKIDMFGPPIKLSEVTTEFVNSTQQAVFLTFDRDDDDDDGTADLDDYYEGEDSDA